MNTGQQVAYLQLFIMTYLLRFLYQAAYPTDPKLLKMTCYTFVQGSSWYWPLKGGQTHSIPKILRRKKKLSVRFWMEVSNSKSRLWTHLVPIAVSIYKVGCRIKGRVREILASCCLRELPSITRLTYTALSSVVNRILAIHFDSVSYPIGIDTHASRCMVNTPHLFEDLKLEDVREVEGIKLGLDIKGTGTFKFKIKDVSASEEANTDDRTVKMSNLPLPSHQEEPSKVIQQGPLTFDPPPPTVAAKDIQLAAANDQAELMRWHYRLGHMSFHKLKQLALNGKISKKLTKVLPPKCACCLFGAMTKLPWQGKEAKANHEVFIATKPGECVSVDQMTSTELGFYVQLKGKLTKKRYKCATVFVDHHSGLRFVHLRLDDGSAETLAAMLAFKQYAAKHRVVWCKPMWATK
jgi:hypothetical protein